MPAAAFPVLPANSSLMQPASASVFSVQRGSFGGPSGHSYRGRGRHRGGWRGYRGGNHGTSGSGWQQMSGSSFHHGSRESGTG
ncbi:hypothetical protein Peur_047152 [Populus x canadensis]